ncbi:hypothetical protein BH10ACI4_BH10ACI4_19340 [soil metagenome]|jgi:hypothetical protein|nr:hypothetical protein [Acidobacteriaceae bacterium]
MSDIDVILANYPGLGQVRLCGCNTVHLSIGPMTLNLAPEAFAQAATLMRKAMEQLSEVLDAQKTELEAVAALQQPVSRLTH